MDFSLSSERESQIRHHLLRQASEFVFEVTLMTQGVQAKAQAARQVDGPTRGTALTLIRPRGDGRWLRQVYGKNNARLKQGGGRGNPLELSIVVKNLMC